MHSSSKLFLATLICFCLACGTGPKRQPTVAASSKTEALVPEFLLGEFQDDYGSKFRITPKIWIQLPTARFEVTRWNVAERYVLAQNGTGNPSDAGLWTRIDWIELEDMAPFRWAFCLSAFSAESETAAEAVTSTDSLAPKTGCNGFPFSRMRRVE